MRRALLPFVALLALCGPVEAQVSGLSTPTPSDGAPPVSAAQAAQAAPVQSVNSAVGAVVVPGSIRASCSISTFDAGGNGSCTLANFQGGSAFTNTPDCFPSFTAGNSGYVYSQPIITSSTASVAVVASAAQKLLNIALGATTIWGAPPSGSVLSMFCRGN